VDGGDPVPTVRTALVPVSLRGYKRAWVTFDIIAGITLAAVAIPETMRYTAIAQTPVVTGLYTVIFPTIVFALLGSSKLLVVGADSATAAILSAGLVGIGVSGLTPSSPEWVAVAFCSSPPGIHTIPAPVDCGVWPSWLRRGWVSQHDDRKNCS
jgi:MFS superfamily sulfate permease-like transporter